VEDPEAQTRDRIDRGRRDIRMSMRTYAEWARIAAVTIREELVEGAEPDTLDDAFRELRNNAATLMSLLDRYEALKDLG